MAGGEDVNMLESPESKLDSIMNMLNVLSRRTTEIEGFFAKFSGDVRPTTVQPPVQPLPQASTSKEAVAPLFEETRSLKEPRVSLPEKFDGTRSKFRGFVNQVRLITFLQPQRYPTEESRVGLVGTLLTGQALSWFAPLFETRSPILSNFEAFLEAFAEAFGEHDKARWATTKIRALRQGSRSASVYASEFRQLACDINWDEQALMSQFYWGLRDDVKDLLLALPDPQTLNEAINQAVKCDNRLFQRRQDQRSWTFTKQRTGNSYSAASTNTLLPHSGVEDMQIDAVRFKPLTTEEKKRRYEQGLCLYCGEAGHKAGGCLKKQHATKTRSAIIQENEEAQPQ
jgi:hypothetical protein